MQVTEADVQAWLERQADHCMGHGAFTSDLMPGVTELGARLRVSPEHMREARLGHLDLAAMPVPLEFYAIWYGVKLTTERSRAPIARAAEARGPVTEA